MKISEYTRKSTSVGKNGGLSMSTPQKPKIKKKKKGIGAKARRGGRERKGK